MHAQIDVEHSHTYTLKHMHSLTFIDIDQHLLLIETDSVT